MSQIVGIIICLIRFLVATSLYLVCFFRSYKVKNTNKMTPFERGFAGVGAITSSFSIHFFILVVIFIIFELEIVLLIGVIFSLRMYGFAILILFILGGIYLEYYLGKLR